MSVSEMRARAALLNAEARKLNAEARLISVSKKMTDDSAVPTLHDTVLRVVAEKAGADGWVRQYAVLRILRVSGRELEDAVAHLQSMGRIFSFKATGKHGGKVQTFLRIDPPGESKPLATAFSGRSS